MNWALVCLFAISLAGCGSLMRPPPRQHRQRRPRTRPWLHRNLFRRSDDEKNRTCSYPARRKSSTPGQDAQRHRGHIQRLYKTSDSPMQVAAFYRAEGAKLGTLQKESLAVGELLQSVGVDRTDGSRSAIQAATDGKGVTAISLHRSPGEVRQVTASEPPAISRHHVGFKPNLSRFIRDRERGADRSTLAIVSERIRPFRSLRKLRSAVMICETFATDGCLSPVSRGESRTLPGQVSQTFVGGDHYCQQPSRCGSG